MGDAARDFSATKIAIGNDHVAVELKNVIVDYLTGEMGFKKENIIKERWTVGF